MTRNAAWGVAATAVGVGAALAAGAAYQRAATAADERRYPPPGRLVDTPSGRLHVTEEGEGSPTIVLIAGLGMSTATWLRLTPLLAPHTRVVSYDRAGVGWSDEGEGPRDALAAAKDLEHALATAGVMPPYVLVANSFGGLIARVFAARRATGDVAGLVLADTSSEHLYVDPKTRRAGLKPLKRVARMAPFGIIRLATRLGIAPEYVRIGMAFYDTVPEPPRGALVAQFMSSTGARTEAAEWEGFAESLRQAASAKLGDIPVVIVARDPATNPGDPEGEAASLASQEALLGISSNSRLVIAEGSGHVVPFDAPEILAREALSLLSPGRAGR